MEAEINISNVIVNGKNIYLHYDITITEDVLNEQKQLDVDLSEIKDNILKYDEHFDNNTVEYYYDNGYEIYVLLTYRIQKIKADRDVDDANITELFKILYKFTKFDYSIVTNETIKFYKSNEEEFDCTLTNLSVLNIKFNYIRDNSSSEDGQQETDQTASCSVEVGVEKPEGITPIQDNSNDYYIVKFVEPKEPPIPEYDTSNDDNGEGFVRDPQEGFTRNPEPERTQPANLIVRKYTDITYIQTESHNIDLLKYRYKNVDFSNIKVNSYKELMDSDNIIKSTNNNIKNSLYDHIMNFLYKMNQESVYKKLQKITGNLNSSKRKKLKKLFTDNGLNPNNGGGAKKSKETNGYGNFCISKWNYNREYNALKYFYKENDWNTNYRNPLKDVMNLICTDYIHLIIYSHTKSIYSL